MGLAVGQYTAAKEIDVRDHLAATALLTEGSREVMQLDATPRPG